jgi:hypothetical protein
MKLNKLIILTPEGIHVAIKKLNASVDVIDV